MRRAVVLVAALGLAAGALASAPSMAATSPGPYYPVDDQVVVNVPRYAGGTSAQQYAFHNMVVGLTNATPKGETITVSTFSINTKKVTDAFIAAKKRGVNVRFNMWGERAVGYPTVDQLRAGLGTNTSAASYFKACTGSCYLSGSAGIQHAKAITFSKVQRTKTTTTPYVTLIGAQNMTDPAAQQMWNNTQVITRNPYIYAAARDYAQGMRLDKTKRGFASVATTSYRLWMFPATSKSYDPVLAELNNVSSCTAKSGYGISGKTAIRVVMYNWTSARVEIADRLVSLRKKGCNVSVLVTGNAVTSSILTKLIKAGIPTYDGYADLNHNGTKDTYVHGKTLMVDGTVVGASKKEILGGSANFTDNSLTDNTEVIIKVVSASNTAKHFAWFNTQIKFAQKLTKAPSYPTLSKQSTEPNRDGLVFEEPIERG